MRSHSPNSQAYQASRQLIKERLLDGGDIKFTVSGSSMFPALRNGDNVLFRNLAPDELKRGEIILYERDGRFFTHRFYSSCEYKGERYLLVKGDNPLQPVELLKVSSVIGLGVSAENTRGGRNTFCAEASIPGSGALMCMKLFSFPVMAFLRLKFLLRRMKSPFVYGHALTLFLLPITIPCWISLWPGKNPKI